MSYDDWRMHGETHRCDCGASYTDSDGGPCHFTCKECGDLVGDESESDTYCQKCFDALNNVEE